MVSAIDPSPSIDRADVAVARLAYDSLRDFYADSDRRASRERDLGLRWRSADGASYRAAWIEATDELYVMEHLDPDGGGGDVTVLGRLTAEEVDERLDGWEEICGEPASYEWLVARAAGAEAP